MRVIDIHTHGLAGYDTKGATPEDILRIAEIHGKYGVDAVIPTVYSASIDQMRTDIAAVKKAMEMQVAEGGSSRFKVQGSRLENNRPNGMLKNDPARGDTPARILGVHLEGPFLNPARAGALDKSSFLPARISSWESLVEGFGDIIKIITVAPELDGAAAMIRRMNDDGIIVSMGHSDATYAEAEEGFHAGAKGITHLFNAMRGIHHREPGIAAFGVTNPHVYVEVIADPFHLHRKMIELIFQIKNPEKIIIVSDSIKATKTDAMKGGVADSKGRLMGGSMTIIESAQRLVDMGFPKNTVEQCISLNPEEYLK
jgi:N-acetylglucosamine-6-phosphate deacetylase